MNTTASRDLLGGHEVTLKLTVEQAHAIAQLLELSTRMGMCQFHEFEYWARSGIIKHRDGRELTMEECTLLEYMLARISNIFGFPTSASHGMGSQHVSEVAKRGYEVKKVLEKALAEFHDPNPKGLRGVNYDGLICRFTDDSAPVAKVEG